MRLRITPDGHRVPSELDLWSEGSRPVFTPSVPRSPAGESGRLTSTERRPTDLQVPPETASSECS